MKALEQEKNSYSLSRQKTPRPTHFYCHAPDANQVLVEGDFNAWTGTPMIRQSDGWWYLSTQVNPGHHRYRFLVDGVKALDPDAMGVGHDEGKGSYSIVAIN
jgi:1,4-alpha-glucan branching enzyme